MTTPEYLEWKREVKRQAFQITDLARILSAMTRDEPEVPGFADRVRRSLDRLENRLTALKAHLDCEPTE